MKEISEINNPSISPFFPLEKGEVVLPDHFPDPFQEQPHPIAQCAAEHLMRRLAQLPCFHPDRFEGKMLGVLVVLSPDQKQLGYLAAFSGYLPPEDMQKSSYLGFVPPIYNLTDPNGFFKHSPEGETQIQERKRDRSCGSGSRSGCHCTPRMGRLSWIMASTQWSRGHHWMGSRLSPMCKFVHCLNLIEVLKNGEKVLIQKPEQIERLKDIILDYNRGALDYDNIDMLIIDAGAGGGGTDIAQFLMNEWVGKDRKMHLGFIDKTDPYMSLREDDYPANRDNLRMFNFKRDKVQAYERAQNAINQGLAIFPASLNARNEIEFEDVSADGSVRIRYEKADGDELASLVQMDLAKEELIAMQKIKKPNGTIQFDLSPDAKSRNFHDDRADCVAMILDRLMEIRANEALVKETPKEDFKKVFSSRPV